MERLEGKVALVTGGSRGIGYAAAARLLADGALVAISARQPQGVAAAVAGLAADRPGAVIGVAAHVGRPEDSERLVAEVLSRWGRIDLLVNNAATNPHFGPTLDVEPMAWAKTLEVNLTGPLVLSQMVYRAWLAAHGGGIINVSSVGGGHPALGLGVYDVTKAALNMLTRQLALELGPQGIRVNAVAPGIVRTDFAAPLWSNPAIVEETERRHPLGRFAKPEEVAAVIAFLASDESSYVNGSVLEVDGGYR